jgi:hypothetical protein
MKKKKKPHPQDAAGDADEFVNNTTLVEAVCKTCGKNGPWRLHLCGIIYRLTGVAEPL